MNNGAIDFFVFACLGITYTEAKEDKEKVLEKCFYRAYLDMNRTIRYKDDVKKNEKSKKDFFKDVFKEIRNFYENIPSSVVDFNNKHVTVCNKITKIGNRYVKEEFSDGQSQKILNMTLKYLMLLGDEKVCNCKKMLHVPVDNYIIEAVWNNEKQIDAIPYIDDKLRKDTDESGKRIPGQFSSDKFKAWSNWDYSTYNNFQIYIDAIKGDDLSRIEWENYTWINNANKE